MDSSWVFALILATWTLVSVAGHMLSSPSAAGTLVGAGAAIGLFASLAVHARVRALSCRACGVPVRRLALFVFGGLTVVLAFASHGDRVAAAMGIAFAGWFVTSGAAKAYESVVSTDAGPGDARWHQGALES